MTAAILTSSGYAADLAPSGRDALRMARERTYDLILLDINMPEMDGWQTLRLLHADEALSTVPVVMFSVKSEFRDRIQGMQEGAIDYIVKPFEVDDLLARVARVLDAAGRGGRRSAPAPVR